MRGEYIKLSCPFCDEGKIEAWHIPGTQQERRTGRSSLGKGKAVTKSSDVWIIKSGCNQCSKNQEEVEKKVKNDGII